jgi:hypothetical protein
MYIEREVDMPLGNNRATESEIKALINMGLIYIGEDNQLHVVDKEER